MAARLATSVPERKSSELWRGWIAAQAAHGNADLEEVTACMEVHRIIIETQLKLCWIEKPGSLACFAWYCEKHICILSSTPASHLACLVTAVCLGWSMQQPTAALVN